MVTFPTKEKEIVPSFATKEVTQEKLAEVVKEEEAAIEKIEEEIKLPQEVADLGVVATPSPTAQPAIVLPVSEEELTKALQLRIKDALGASIVWLACWCVRLIQIARQHGRRIIFRKED